MTKLEGGGKSEGGGDKSEGGVTSQRGWVTFPQGGNILTCGLTGDGGGGQTGGTKGHIARETPSSPVLSF